MAQIEVESRIKNQDMTKAKTRTSALLLVDAEWVEPPELLTVILLFVLAS